MTDVIDALKRLERVGSENSKTTQKLIDAAAELSAKIAACFQQYPDDTVIVEANYGGGGRAPSAWKRSYAIRKDQVCIIDSKGNLAYVASDRGAALAFSKDIAAGLLEGIVQSAETYQKVTADALPPLADALSAFKGGATK